MERDFLGLSSKETLPVVKEEVNSEGYKETGFAQGLGIQWPLCSKVSSPPHVMSFKDAQAEKIKKYGYGSTSSGDAYDPFRVRIMVENLKSFNHARLGGAQFSPTAYPMQHDVKMLPAYNNAMPISMGNPFFKNHFATGGQSSAMKPQLLGGVPVSAPRSFMPSVASVAGLPESCGKTSGSSSQLTIFYAGTVNVYDDISPEKAQAIMLLAGNGSCTSSNMTLAPPIQFQTLSSKPAVDVNPVGQNITTPSSPRLSSPLSVSSHTGAQSGSGSTSTEEILSTKTTGVATNSVSQLETPKITSPVETGAATNMIPSAVPLARKASLARFLEKRKERVMNTAPYTLCKKSPEIASPESGAMTSSAPSATGRSFFSPLKECNQHA